MILYLELDEYLAQWFVHSHGGNRPVSLIRGSIESNYLEQFLTLPPDDLVPQITGGDAVAILLPNFRSKDTRYYHYLPPKATDGLKTLIRNRFDCEMWQELHRFANLFKRQDSLIYSFMEAHGIDLSERNWNAVSKRYRRKLDLYNRVRRRKQNLKK